jgi:hypothetical protein
MVGAELHDRRRGGGALSAAVHFISRGEDLEMLQLLSSLFPDVLIER